MKVPDPSRVFTHEIPAIFFLSASTRNTGSRVIGCEMGDNEARQRSLRAKGHEDDSSEVFRSSQNRARCVRDVVCFLLENPPLYLLRLLFSPAASTPSSQTLQRLVDGVQLSQLSVWSLWCALWPSLLQVPTPPTQRLVPRHAEVYVRVFVSLQVYPHRGLRLFSYGALLLPWLDGMPDLRRPYRTQALL